MFIPQDTKRSKTKTNKEASVAGHQGYPSIFAPRMTRGCSPNFKMCHMNEQTAWNERIIENEDAFHLQNFLVSTDPPQVTTYICRWLFIAGTSRPNSFHPKGKSNLEGRDDAIIMINDQQEVVILERKTLKKGRASTCTPIK